MSLGPLAVIGFCAAVAAVGELLQVRGGRGCCGFRRRCRHCAADRRGSQGSFELGSSASGLSACRSALPLAQLHLKLVRKLFKPPTKAMARVAPPRRRRRPNDGPAPSCSCLQWFFVWRTPAFQALRANLAKHLQKVEEAKEVRARGG